MYSIAGFQKRWVVPTTSPRWSASCEEEDKTRLLTAATDNEGMP
jgi:hypothetical protein